MFSERHIPEGTKVAVVDIDPDCMRGTVATLGGNAFALHLDVTNQDRNKTAASATVERFGQIEILINNAGLFAAAPTVGIDRADDQRVFDINVAGPLFMTQAVARRMIDRDIDGRIINRTRRASRCSRCVVPARRTRSHTV